MSTSSSAAAEAEATPKLVCVGVRADDFPKVWGRVAEHFAEFERAAKGELFAADLVRAIMQRERQCWIVTDGHEVRATILSRVEGGPMQAVQVDFCTGEGFSEWLPVVEDTIRRWAESIGSRRVRVVHRPGWMKPLRSLGYKETHRVSEIDVGEVR